MRAIEAPLNIGERKPAALGEEFDMRSRRTDAGQKAQNDNKTLLVLRRLYYETRSRPGLSHSERVRMVERLLDEIEPEELDEGR